jgi:hypothetical protein
MHKSIVLRIHDETTCTKDIVLGTHDEMICIKRYSLWIMVFDRDLNLSTSSFQYGETWINKN